MTLASFDGLGLIEPLRLALKAENYLRPTPIQTRTIPLLAAGKDLLGIAETGTGKTAAFALPILQRLAAERPAQ
ncbi:MAG TPA: DEAD/DEAH box helicase, partial [Methyloceanibacter sp.]|nr:DEAD/DEAH box helicase [Methyloceanibacter sp.]